MARPREFDSDKVSDALRDVFWERGYEGTSYSNIMAATGLQKGSLYSAFGDKRSLYLEALSRYDKQNVSAAVAILSNKDMTGEARIDALMQSLVDAAQTKQGRWGCLLCNAATDMAPFDAETENQVMASMTRIKKAIEIALKETSNPKNADLVCAAYFGGRTLIKAGASKSVLRALKKQVLSALN